MIKKFELWLVLCTAAPGNTFANKDTLEDIWGGSKADKTYSAIKTVLQLAKTETVPETLDELVSFVYADCMEG